MEFLLHPREGGWGVPGPPRCDHRFLPSPSRFVPSHGRGEGRHPLEEPRERDTGVPLVSVAGRWR